MGKWLKLFVFLLGIFGLLGIGVVASYFQAEIFIYNPVERRSAIEKTPADFGMPFEDVAFVTEDELLLKGWYIPSQNGANVILVHGYKNNRATMLSRAQVLARHGYGVLLFDLRTHGESEGALITFGLYEVLDVNAAYQALRSRPDVDPERIGILGGSMGGTVALLSAVQLPSIKAVVAESAFPTLQDAIPSSVANSGLPSVFFAPVVQWFAERLGHFRAEQISAVDLIGQISPRPVFLLQGGKDLLVVPESGQRLYDAAGDPRELWFEPTVGHMSFIDEKPAEYEERVVRYFDAYLLEK
ncbi:MAG: alpha/beta hydrolase [Chloroflexota bacterium]